MLSTTPFAISLLSSFLPPLPPCHRREKAPVIGLGAENILRRRPSPGPSLPSLPFLEIIKLLLSFSSLPLHFLSSSCSRETFIGVDIGKFLQTGFPFFFLRRCRSRLRGHDVSSLPLSRHHLSSSDTHTYLSILKMSFLKTKSSRGEIYFFVDCLSFPVQKRD